MKELKILIPGLLLMILLSCNSNSTQIFVAPNGSDTNGTGSIEQPFASLERVRDEIRMLKNEGDADKGFHVTLREGNYYRSETFTLTEEDSGEEEFPVVYTAYNDEKVVIHGGISIPVEKKNGTIAQDILARFQPGIRDKIVEIDLQKEGITDYGKMRPVGFSRPFGPTWAELFVNGEPYE
ncbi:MAG: hypothetical protein LC658_15940, partial [Bacteroidales bacterium]|nr:hypothetical protein [Bacteroidales bacterium]